MDSLDNPRIYFFSICVLLYYQVVNLLTINVIIIVAHEEYVPITMPTVGEISKVESTKDSYRKLSLSQQTFFPNHSFKLIVNHSSPTVNFQIFEKKIVKIWGVIIFL